MSDTKPMTKAEEACWHTFCRVIDSRDFSWHMIATQTLHLVLEAEAERRGMTYKEIEAELHAAMTERNEQIKHQGDRPEPREKQLEREIGKLQRQVAGLKDRLDEDDDDDDDLEFVVIEFLELRREWCKDCGLSFGLVERFHESNTCAECAERLHPADRRELVTE